MRAVVKKRFVALVCACVLLASCGLAEQAAQGEICVPDQFVFSGGSGKVTITCPEFTLNDGAVTAKIVFSSDKYTQARLGDQVYHPEVVDSCAVFTLPVALNRSFTLYATTMAMSAPHEIAYDLYIGWNETGLPGLAYEGSMDLSYARGFSVDFYEGGYALIDVKEHETYLIVPEDQPVPEGLNPDITVLQKPFGSVYLAATSAMSLFDAIGALDCIRLSGTQADGWYVQNAVDAMERGDILFAGKYSEPDFELLVREECDLAVESMMILHTPNVRELIELLGIPVFIDRSSSEDHPLGRLEWVRLYGLITGCEQEADAAFESQVTLVGEMGQRAATGKTVAFFSLKPDGTVTVRGSRDYIARCVELAGGAYAFDGIEGQETNASVNLTMEAFYDTAREADVLIYNASIQDEISTIDELLIQQPLFADMKAVGTGDVFCTEKSLYQSTNAIGTFIADLRMILSREAEGMTFLYRLSK